MYIYIYIYIYTYILRYLVNIVFHFGIYNLFKKWAKEKKEDYTFLQKKEKKNQNSITITVSVDGKGTFFTSELFE